MWGDIVEEMLWRDVGGVSAVGERRIGSRDGRVGAV